MRILPYFLEQTSKMLLHRVRLWATDIPMIVVFDAAVNLEVLET
mgnify:CR=1 FL=1